MFVYTFWEPRERIPAYLQLCMETWKKFLPNATIVVPDYKNIGEFLDVRELGSNLFSGRFSLPQIADALGYTQAEISAVFADAPPNSTTEELIKFALKNLNRFA